MKARNNEERWKAIKDYEGLYEVSNQGRIKRVSGWKGQNGAYIQASGIIGENNIKKNGYKGVVLCKNGKCKSFLIHRLVAQTFIPNPHNLPQVNHIDGDKTNNCVENLEWVTPQQNVRHAFDKGLKKPHSQRSIIAILPEGKIHFSSISECSRSLHICISAICQHCQDNKPYKRKIYFMYE